MALKDNTSTSLNSRSLHPAPNGHPAASVQAGEKNKNLVINEMNLQELFRDVLDEIANRKEILTEDNVRFILFAKMLKQDADLEHYILEQPYPYPPTSPTNKMELDLYYKGREGKICFEIKFHQNGGEKSEYPHTMSAGELFNDIKRLIYLKSTGKESKRCVLFYVTDDEMFDYLTNVSNSNKTYRQTLHNFFKGGSSCNIDESNCPHTFTRYANHSRIGPNGKYSLNVQQIFYGNVQSDCQSLKKNGVTAKARCHCYAFEVE